MAELLMDSCDVQYSLDTRGDEPVHVWIAYGINSVKANSKSSRKSFFSFR